MRRYWKDHPTAFWGLFAAGTTIIVFFPAIFNGFVNWDDSYYLLDNLYVHHPERFGVTHLLFTPALGYPLPVAVAVYRAINAAFGLNPLPYHLFGVAIHTLSGLLLFLLFRQWYRPGIAVAAVLFFALHPLSVEPTVWVTGIKDLLALLFSLAALNVFVRMVSPTPPFGSLPLFLMSGLLAILSKPSAIVLIPLLIIGMWCFGPVNSTAKKGIWLSLGTFLAAGAMLVWAGTHGVRAYDTYADFRLDESYVTRILDAFWHQLRHLVYPTRLLPYYPGNRDTLRVFHIVPAVIVLAALATAVWAVLRRQRRMFFFLAWCGMTYAPFSNIVPLNRFTADSYFYMPLVGIAGLVAEVLVAVDRRWTGREARRAVVPVIGVILICFAVLSIRQGQVWRDPETLWTPALAVHPDDPKITEYYADGLVHMGQDEKALAFYRKNEAIWRKAGFLPVTYMPLLAKLGFTDEALSRFIWTLDNSHYRIDDVRKNFIRFLLNTEIPPTPRIAVLARTALPAFVETLTADEPERLVHIARFAGDVGAFDIAETLISVAVAADPRPVFMEMGRAACRMQHKGDCEKRWGMQKK